MDPLSSALMLMKLRTGISGASSAAGKWSLAIPDVDALKLYLVLRGEGWIVLSRAKSKFHLKPGDCLLVTTGEACIATNDLTIKTPLELKKAFELIKDDVIMINGGGESFTISIIFEFEGHLSSLLFKGLPPAIFIPSDDEEAESLRTNIERFRQEYLKKDVGSSLVLNHLAPIILIQIIRAYLSTNPAGQNWFLSISDPKLSKAMEAMHSDCAHDWSVQSLADICGMSRAGFAAKFKEKIGLTPKDYLTNWRMQVACRLLKESNDPILEIAETVGFESESAFSASFKRLIGVRPGVFRKAPDAQNSYEKQ